LSDQTPTLFNAIPAIEGLHSAWSTRADKFKYAPFKDVLHAAKDKVNEYYEKTADSDAHILAMCMCLCKSKSRRKVDNSDAYFICLGIFYLFLNILIDNLPPSLSFGPKHKDCLC
jgi:hypothetical protein